VSDSDTVYVVGHRRPDTDSGVSAVVFSRLLSRQDASRTFVPILLDPPVAQTVNLFKRAGIELPSVCADLRRTVAEVMRPPVIQMGNITLKQAMEPVQMGEADSIVIVDEQESFLGILTDRTSDNRFFLLRNVEDFLGVLIGLPDLVQGLELEKLAGGAPTGPCDSIRILTALAKDTVVSASEIIVSSPNQEILEACRKGGAAAVILVDGTREQVLELASDWEGTPLYYFPGSFFALACGLSLCLPAEYIMLTEVECFEPNQLLYEIMPVLAKHHHSLPVVDASGKPVGVLGANDVIDLRLKKIVLVDHFDQDQAIPGFLDLEVIEIIDHHRVGNLETPDPIRVDCRPWGSTATVIAARYEEAEQKLGEGDALLLLGALVADTLLLTSPTTTEVDRRTAKSLAQLAQVDLEVFGQEVLEWNDVIHLLPAEELVTHDCKQFSYQECLYMLAQLETVALNKVTEKRMDELRFAMHVQCQKAGAAFGVLMVTDVLKSSSQLVFCCDDTQQGWWSSQSDRQEQGMVSRKNQLLPWVIRQFRQMEAMRG